MYKINRKKSMGIGKIVIVDQIGILNRNSRYLQHKKNINTAYTIANQLNISI